MSDEIKDPSQSGTSAPKKILESSPLSGIAVPIAIVLVGGMIIFGVTKMLSTGKNHRDLVEEMNSKTFGNRWIAAYELSKFLAAQKIPSEDMPWVIENLSKVYEESVDSRTRNFVVLALGSLNNPLALPILNSALEDEDPQVKFNAVVALGNTSKGADVKWDRVEAMLSGTGDPGLQQVALLALASHDHPSAQEKALIMLNSPERTLRYAASIVLVKFKNQEAVPILEEILNLRYDVSQSGELNGAQVEALKVNVLENIEKFKLKELSNLVQKVEQDDSNIRVNTKAKQVLKVLKN
jgi:HEAT repeat protein